MSWLNGAVPGPAWLFCPADRPDRFHKAAAAADVVILDLEDAVAADSKAEARDALIGTPLDPNKTVVRINASGTEDQRLDLVALAATKYTRLMLAKCESAQQITALAPLGVIALVETAYGALSVVDSARANNTIGLMWGAEDLVADLGGQTSRHVGGGYRDVALHLRSSTLLAAKAHDRFALDAVYLDLGDLDGLRVETIDSVASGFDAKVAIHPSQVDVIRDAYAPAEHEIDWARRAIAQSIGQHGVFALDGRMVDAPLLRQAEAILRRSSPKNQSV